MDELLPCPFCGGAAIIDAIIDDRGEPVWMAGCKTVCAVSPDVHADTAAEVTVAWNTRMPTGSDDLQLIWDAIDRGGGQTCDVAGVLRELRSAGYVIAPAGDT